MIELNRPTLPFPVVEWGMVGCIFVYKSVDFGSDNHALPAGFYTQVLPMEALSAAHGADPGKLVFGFSGNTIIQKKSRAFSSPANRRSKYMSNNPAIGGQGFRLAVGCEWRRFASTVSSSSCRHIARNIFGSIRVSGSIPICNLSMNTCSWLTVQIPVTRGIGQAKRQFV